MQGMDTMLRSRCMVAALFALLPLIFVAAAEAAPKADLWERWTPDGVVQTAPVDHSGWDRFLKRFVVVGHDGINRVDYSRIGPQDQQELARYIASLASRQPTRMMKREAKAYWINLYNALTVQTVLKHYPVASIRDIDISPGLFSNGPWGAELLEVEGIAISLDDIEHRILRPIWRDPLVHYALNCAAVGCPQLRAEAYVPHRLEEQLDDSARTFINHPRALHFSDGALSVSSIYEWFMEDFGTTDGEVIGHIRGYAEPELEMLLQRHSRISDDFYDWTLNDASLLR